MTFEEYPEHVHLKSVRDQSQAIGNFIEWLEENNMAICEFNPRTNFDSYTPTRTSTTKLLALHFEVDLDRLEDEKRAMLDELGGT